MWHTIMTERFGAKDPKSSMLRFHTQTGGSTLTAQQPMNNIMRVTLQAMASVLGGTQSLHTNGYDEALSLPTEEAARMALRTQQIIGYESGVADTPDPLAGSYFVESLTDEVERLAWEYIERIDEMGGAVTAIEAGFQMDEIEQAAYEYTKSIDDDERVIVGVNKFTMDDEPEPKVFPIDPELEGNQIARLAAYKANRDTAAVESALAAVQGHRAGHRQPALQHEGRAARRRHARRDQRRVARGVRRLHPVTDPSSVDGDLPAGQTTRSRRSTGRSKRSAWTRASSSGPPRRRCERPNVVRQSCPIGARTVRDAVAAQLPVAVGGHRAVEPRRRAPTGGDAVARHLGDLRSPTDRRRHGGAAAALAVLHPAGWRLGRPVRPPPAADATRHRACRGDGGARRSDRRSIRRRSW